ncbi:MAG TPA: methyltransferase domain-containing protein [Candidatus Saccharimonadales bacterium]|nr:methyltransferase domain-containing protein [Candidatus Saccharimonadales bacterium]
MKNFFQKRGAKVNAAELLLKGRKRPIKLNVGCGTDYKEGWINIDNNSDNNIEKLDLNWDLREPLPFPDRSVDYIFNEHFMEHLTPEEGIKANQDFLRVLRKGGVLRIAMPNLEETVALYMDKDWRKHTVLNNHGLGFVKTRAELLNMAVRWWGHMWLYDWEELRRRLQDAGAKNITRVKHSTSRHKPLNGLETREESTLIAEVTK